VLFATQLPSAAAEYVETAVHQARELLRTGDARKAVAVLNDVVAKDKYDAVTHYWLARAYGETARNASMFRMMSLAKKAGAGFARAVELDPDFVDARFALMEFHLMAPRLLGGRIDEARAQAEEIRRRDAIAGHRAFAALAIAANDLDQARHEHLEAMRIRPDSADAVYWYGVFLMLHTREYKAASEQFESALNLYPGFISANFQIGHVAALAGDGLDRGVDALQTYLNHETGDDDLPRYRAHYWLGMIYEQQGKQDDARAQFQAALHLRPGDKELETALARVL
jgi:Tfp pilus assembly protein PilF